MIETSAFQVSGVSLFKSTTVASFVAVLIGFGLFVAFDREARANDRR
jgi:hypothetical protein